MNFGGLFRHWIIPPLSVLLIGSLVDVMIKATVNSKGHVEMPHLQLCVAQSQSIILNKPVKNKT